MATGPTADDWKTVEPSDWQTVGNADAPPVQDPDYDSVLSEAGKHPKTAALLKAIPSVAATGLGIAASETGPGAVGAAAVGGTAGKALENELEERFGFKRKQTSAGSEAGELGIEGAKQAAYEAGGRAVGAFGRTALAPFRGISPEVVGETIGGVKVPETLGQSSGKRLPQAVEHYLQASWLGKPLQAVKEAQQAASRQILANLSKATEAAPGALAGNWERATQETKILGDSMYGALDKIEAPTVGPAAKQLLEDESLRLPGKAKAALEKASGIGGSDAEKYAKDLGKALGFKDFHDPKLISQLPKEVQAELRGAGKATVGDAIAARSELRDLAINSPDRNLQRLYQDAYDKLNGAIDASLTPEQRALKTEADKVWRRSYIQEDITKELQKMQFVQAPGKEPAVMADSFVKVVNELAHQPLYREGGKVVTRPSKLDVLFDNPADRTAMKDLAKFLKTKYVTMGGQAGISESIARIGLALEAVAVPGALAAGHPIVAAHAAAGLAGLATMSHLLANPGGAKLLSAYFRSTGAAATALAGRIAEQAYNYQSAPAPRKDSTTPAATVAAPAPRKNPTDEWATATH